MTYNFEIYNHPYILLLFCSILLNALYFIIVMIRERQNKNVNERCDDTSEMDRQVESMLALSGGVLTQNQIQENLGANLKSLLETLKLLEKEGKIIRKWDSGLLTFRCEYHI
ncbi:hypothetical protein ACFL40_05145 [candidate division KSB1 bacterium]